MLENLNSRLFSEHLHTTFQLRIPGEASLPLVLTEATEKDQSQNIEQFSLVFRGPLTPYCPQGTYTFEHERLGKMDLFLVPLGPRSGGMCYQVSFCRMRPDTSAVS